MENATESMRDGAQPFSQTHNLIAEILPELRPCEMQTIFFQCFEDGSAPRGGVGTPILGQAKDGQAASAGEGMRFHVTR